MKTIHACAVLCTYNVDLRISELVCARMQGLPQRWRFLQTFPLWQFAKWIYTGFILNYSASAFLVRPSQTRRLSGHSMQRLCTCQRCCTTCVSHQCIRRVCIGTAGLLLCCLLAYVHSYVRIRRLCVHGTSNCIFPRLCCHACGCLELCSWPLMCSACCVQLLDFSVAFKTWNSVHFLGHFLMVAIIAVSMVNPPRKPRKKDASKAPGGQAVPPIETGGPAKVHSASSSWQQYTWQATRLPHVMLCTWSVHA